MFFAVVVLGGVSLAWARPEPKLLTAQPDAAEGAAVLASFRNVGIAGNYWVKFELRVMPRKGDERLLTGEMLGSAEGPRTRLFVDDLANTGGGHRLIYLLRGGAEPEAAVWNAREQGEVARVLSTERQLAPVQGTDLTVFDLQMPFLRWTDFVYEGVANIRGRPAHAFLMYPPAGFPTTGPAAVRVFLDTQFAAMTQAEWVDAAGKPMKTVTVLDLKKVGEQWLVKSIDLRNHQTRAKTRLTLTAAALGLAAWPESVFARDEVAAPVPAVPTAQIERF